MKNIVEIEVKIAERIFRFACDHEAPLAHVKQALFEFVKEVGVIEARLIEAQKKSEEESKQEEAVNE